MDDYVIVHVGVAISKLDPQEAEETLHYLERIAEKKTAKITGRALHQPAAQL